MCGDAGGDAGAPGGSDAGFGFSGDVGQLGGDPGPAGLGADGDNDTGTPNSDTTPDTGRASFNSTVGNSPGDTIGAIGIGPGPYGGGFLGDLMGIGPAAFAGSQPGQSGTSSFGGWSAPGPSTSAAAAMGDNPALTGYTEGDITAAAPPSLSMGDEQSYGDYAADTAFADGDRAGISVGYSDADLAALSNVGDTPDLASLVSYSADPISIAASPTANLSENAITNGEPIGVTIANAFTDLGDRVSNANLSNVALSVALGLLSTVSAPVAAAVMGVNALGKALTGDALGATLGAVGAVPGAGQAVAGLGVANALSGFLGGPTTASMSQAAGIPSLGTDLASVMGIPSVSLSGLQSAAAQADADTAAQGAAPSQGAANPGGFANGGAPGADSGGEGFLASANYPVASPAPVGAFGYSAEPYEWRNNRLFGNNFYQV